MHVNAKRTAFGGLLLALTVICIMLGSVIETNTLFLLAAASYFVGIMIREAGLRTGVAFYAAAVILGLVLTPNPFYVCSYGAMGMYILVIEGSWKMIGRQSYTAARLHLFWIVKFGVFNLMYIPIVLIFGRLLFARELTPLVFGIVLAAGQIGLLVYDRAYEYVQSRLWGKVRARLFS